MSKNKIILLIVIFVSIMIISLYGTFAMITTQTVEKEDTDLNFIIGKTTNKEITISSNSNKTLDITLENPYEGPLNYGIAYSTESDNKITIGVLNTSENSSQDKILEQEIKKVSVMINNSTDKDVKINIYIAVGYLNGGELILEEGQKLITDVININEILNTNLDESGANSPKITPSMIPIYYEEEDKSWHKADQSNTDINYQWYDYKEKKWANVALVTKESLKENQKLKTGDIISQEDILAYLVWIPRFKYQVWDIENSNDQNKYFYNAPTDGINIQFETGTSTTGEIICQETNNCTGENGQYYTHPAFTVEERELTGMWVGKFETTGTQEIPSILPNYSALTFLNIAEEQQTAQLLTATDHYNLQDSNFDSHIANDLEWSAISYLTNSIYGLCNGAKNGCREIYKNNSLYLNTGTSAGDKKGSSNFGNYSYLGELLDETGFPTEIIDTSKISSTTGNVFGIYDMVGGSYESIMSTNNKESIFLQEIHPKYYNIFTDKPLQGELLYDYDNEHNIGEELWLTRGGSSQDDNPTLNNSKMYNGESQSNVSFRIIIN